MAEADGIGAVLVALQHGDSFFPGGAVSFSWGLEALRADERVCPWSRYGSKHACLASAARAWAS